MATQNNRKTMLTNETTMRNKEWSKTTQLQKQNTETD